MRHVLSPERAAEYIFALAAVVVAPLAMLAPHGMAVMLPIFGVGCGLILWSRGDLRQIPRIPAAFVAGFCLWGSVTLFWTPDPSGAALTILRILVASLAGVLILGVCRSRGGGTGVGDFPILAGISLGIAVVLLAADYIGDNGLTLLWFKLKGSPPLPGAFKSQFNRGASVMVLLFWPLGVWAWRSRRHWVLVILAGLAVALVSSDSFAVKLGFLAGAGAFALMLVSTSWGARLLRVILVTAALGLPALIPKLPVPPDSFAVWEVMPLSAHHRLLIWHFVVERLGEHPLRGWGMDASRSIPGADQTVWIPEHYHGNNGIRRVITGQVLPLHPHNSILQWWLELGFLGGLFLAGLSWWVTRRIERAADFDRIGSASAGAVVAAVAVVSNVSFGAWQSWWLASVWIAAGFCGWVGRGREAGPGSVP